MGEDEDDDLLPARLEEEFVDRVVAKQSDQSKESWGWWATWVWILSGVSLYVTSSSRSIFSISALIFILIGMLFSSIILGGIFYTLECTLSWMITKVLPYESFRRHRHLVSFVGLFLLFAQIVTTFLTARWCFQRFPAF